MSSKNCGAGARGKTPRDATDRLPEDIFRPFTLRGETGATP